VCSARGQGIGDWSFDDRGLGPGGSQPLFLPLCTQVRGIEILRSSPFGDSRKFVIRMQRPSNRKDSPFE
jgi:hypothetical protein